ncbi:hypothetical protein OSG_eHP1_00165 [environmental Halophage eHP-1]|nr:hypothetical protein OSG_eHP1_00165 [environmental Halophage eHP-1]AFH22212.1 hypothetical protein OSG_eHP19_00035 [environmental Halophage eHP-19]
MSNKRHRGQRLGYLDYHVATLSDRLEELDTALSDIRQEHSGKERKVKEQSELLDFRQDVKQRLEKIENQVEGVKKHEEDKTLDMAERQKESAYTVHQEEPDKIDMEENGFSTASEL